MSLLVSPPNDCRYLRLIWPKRATCTAHRIVVDLLALIIQCINSSLFTFNIVYYSEGRRIRASCYFMRTEEVSAETKKSRTERTLHNHQCRTESTLHNHHWMIVPHNQVCHAETVENVGNPITGSTLQKRLRFVLSLQCLQRIPETASDLGCHLFKINGSSKENTVKSLHDVRLF